LSSQSKSNILIRKLVLMILKRIGVDFVSRVVSVREFKNIKKLQGVISVKKLPVNPCRYSAKNAAGTNYHPHLADLTSHVSPCGIRFELSHGQVFGPTPAVCDKENQLILEASCDWGKSPSELGIVKRFWFPTATQLPGKTLLASCLGSETYFHWMTDAMPMLLWEKEKNLLNDYDHFLVHPMFKKFHQESMKYLGISSKKIKFLNKHKRYACETLVLHTRHHVSGRIPKNTIRKIKTFLDPAEPCPQKPVKRIAVLRTGNASRKIENANEIISKLEKNSFKLYQPDHYSIKEQVNIFKKANIVVANHGSALTNIIFCRRGTQVVELFPSNYVNPCYRHIALQTGLKHFPLLDSKAGSSPITRLDKASSDIHIAPDRLNMLLEHILRKRRNKKNKADLSY